MNIIYIKKKTTAVDWSDVLDRQYHGLEKIANFKKDGITLIEIDTNSVISYIKSALEIFRYLNTKNIHIIYVNHVICAYACLLAPNFHKQTYLKIIALHESEPVLGWDFVWKNLKHFTFKVLLRYTKLFHIPLYFFNKVLILNKRQSEAYLKRLDFIQSNFLGIDSVAFKPHAENYAIKGKTVLFFPHNPERFEKGYRNFEKAISLLPPDSYEVLVGGGYLQSEIANIYRQADIVYLTGYYETYSLVMLEAMASNNFIIANKDIGIVINLLEKYTTKELESFGIFVTSQKPDEICSRTKELFYQMQIGRTATTRALLMREGLDETSANTRLYELLETCNANSKN